MSTQPPSEFDGFGPDLVAFYDGLAADNSREYWHAHKAVYDKQIGGPAKALATALSEEFGAVKVFRPNRDVRFSPDKFPYRTSVSMAVEGGGAGTLYFAVAPSSVDLAGGIYTPSREQLRRFRDLQDDARMAKSMDAILADLDGQHFSLMDDDALSTAPRGWAKDHPRIELLRLKRMAIGQAREPGTWLQQRGCLDEVATAWRALPRAAPSRARPSPVSTVSTAPTMPWRDVERRSWQECPRLDDLRTSTRAAVCSTSNHVREQPANALACLLLLSCNSDYGASA